MDSGPLVASRPSSRSAVLSVVTYSTCSVSMILLNKLLMYTFAMPFPISLLLLQNTGAFVLVSLGKQLNLISFPDFSWSVARRWIPLTALFVMMLVSSMKSLQHMSVSAQTIIKNLAIIATALGDKWLYGKRMPPGIVFSFVLMIVGSYLGAQGDKWVSRLGLVWTAGNIVSTVAYTLYMKKLMSDLGRGLGPYGPVYYNNLLSVPVFFFAGLWELKPFLFSLAHCTPAALGFLGVMTAVSSLMTFGVFWCMKETSPTTFSVVGALNKVPVTLLGIVIFQQFPSMMGYLGIALALLGGLLYSYSNSRLSSHS